MWQLCIKYLRFQRRQENEKFACDAIVRLGELSLGFNDLPNQPVVKVFITGQDMFVSLPTSSMLQGNNYPSEQQTVRMVLDST